jgi:hypothetical protein
LFEYITGKVLTWVADSTIHFCGEPVHFPLEHFPNPVYHYAFQRWCFRGFTVVLQISDDGITWFDGPTASLGPGWVLDPIATINFLFNTWKSFIESNIFNQGAFIDFGGRTYTEGFSSGMDAVNGNVLKLVVEMEQFNEPVQIEHYFRRTNDASVDPGSDVSLVADYVSSVASALLGCMDVSVAIKKYRAEWRVQGANTILPRTYIVNSVGGAVGTANGGVAGADASQLSYVISWYTNFAGRGERGRTFIPGTSHAFIEENRVTAPGITALANYVTGLFNGFNGDEDVTKAWQMVLWRQHLTNPALVPGDDGEYANPLNTAVPPSVAEWPGHDEEGRPIYVNPPTTRPPFSPAAAQHAITLGTPQDKIKTQRRRGPGVRISRHRALVS